MRNDYGEKSDRYSDEDWEHFKMQGWQPAIIATHEHVAALHRVEVGTVTKFAGAKIRVRENQEARDHMDVERAYWLGCIGHSIEVHPEDARKLWPEFLENNEKCSICTCRVLMD